MGGIGSGRPCVNTLASDVRRLDIRHLQRAGAFARSAPGELGMALIANYRCAGFDRVHESSIEIDVPRSSRDKLDEHDPRPATYLVHLQLRWAPTVVQVPVAELWPKGSHPVRRQLRLSALQENLVWKSADRTVNARHGSRTVAEGKAWGQSGSLGAVAAKAEGDAFLDIHEGGYSHSGGGAESCRRASPHSAEAGEIGAHPEDF